MKTIDAEGIFLGAEPLLAGALAIAREGMEDTSGKMENQRRFSAIVDLLKKYQNAIEKGTGGQMV